ncbi:MAG: hypothetical protein ABIF10_06105 [Candidatus Woesearchaeota archaeon]
MAAFFVFGFSASSLYSDYGQESEQPAVSSAVSGSILGLPSDRASPHDWIKEDQIHVYSDKVVIDLRNAEWATFTDTKSMDPVIDFRSNAIEVVPAKPEDIHLGDIVSYESKYASGTIIHRVVEIGNDEDGWYCRLKGDNLDDKDPGKVRFGQIRRVVVAVIY